MTVKLEKKESKAAPLKIMVSSTVYGIEELLERIYGMLEDAGYEVWLSHKGTVMVYPNLTAFDTCFKAVENCDLFLGIITPFYGSGKEKPGSLSITHQEILKSIELNKPRWFLVDSRIPFARVLLRNERYLQNRKKRPLAKAKRFLKKNSAMDDLRVIDMYEAAIRHDLKTYQDKKGNWVQSYSSNPDALLFATAQFHRYHEVEAFISEHFADRGRVESGINERRKGGKK